MREEIEGTLHRGHKPGTAVYLKHSSNTIKILGTAAHAESNLIDLDTPRSRMLGILESNSTGFVL
jgi:hypothetical protein